VNYKRWTLFAAVLGSGIVFLDSSVVNVALPRIGRELPVHFFAVLEGQSYVYTGYLLTLSALLILAGALNDFYGRRRMFTLGLLGFGATSLLCGLAPNMELLIVFRLFQGAAGALLVPGSLAILTATFSGEEQGRAFGVWSGASAATIILGPVIGGLLVDTISWRAAFLINIPLIAVAIWATLQHVRESRDENATGHFDWLGSVLVALGVGGLAMGSIYGQQRDWRDPIAFIALAVGAVAIILLPILMARSKNPLIPLSLFKSRNFTVTNISTLVIYGALYVQGYFSALFQQGILGYTAAAAGLSFLPGSILLAVFSPRFGVLAARFGPRRFMAVGPAIMTLGTLWFARIPESSQPWILRPDMPSSWWPPLSYWTDIFPGGVIFGLGLMIMVAPLTTALMTSVPVQRSGLASAINNCISRVGPQLAGAVIFIAITATFYQGMATRTHTDMSSPQVRSEISPLNPPHGTISPAMKAAARSASTDAFHLAMLVSAGMLLSGALVNWFGIRDPRQAARAREAPGQATSAAGVVS
jgi:EmrB/QacA subfamily drug resistance transporter